jgi:hypothetical protein
MPLPRTVKSSRSFWRAVSLATARRTAVLGFVDARYTPLRGHLHSAPRSNAINNFSASRPKGYRQAGTECLTLVAASTTVERSVGHL